MVDVSKIRTDWEDVSEADWQVNSARAQANRLTAEPLNALGLGVIEALSQSGTGGGGGLDVEGVHDAVAALLKPGVGVIMSYDDVANTLTINATTGGGTTDPEIVRDVIGSALVAGSGVTVTVNDAGDSITIAVAGVPISAVTGLQTALDDKSGTDHTHTPGSIGAAPAAHTHAAADVTSGTLAIARIPTGTTGTTVALGSHTHTPASIGAAPASHTHDDRYYTETESDARFVRTVNGTGPDGSGNVTVAGGSTTQTINAQTGTAYTLAVADAGKVVTSTNAAAQTITAPANVFTAGQRVDVLRAGAGSLTLAAGSGMTLNGTPSLVLRAQWSAATVLFLSATEAVVIGDLATP